jgi:hypothetical protein
MKRHWIALAVGVSVAGGAHAALDNAAAEAPNVLASDADIKDLVDWILTLKK